MRGRKHTRRTSKMLTRFADVDPINAEPAIDDYIHCKLVTLEQSIKSLTNLVDKIIIHASTAKSITENISQEDGLTHDEAAAIYLYSMETGSRSLYRLLNDVLRKNNAQKLKLWFLYLKLLHTALNKLPSVQERVWRGIPKNVSASYTQGRRIIWKSVSSCSTDAGAVQAFLNQKAQNTLFSIDCKNGKIISKYSAFSEEQELILMPGTLLRVKNKPFEMNGLHLVDLEELPNPNIIKKYSVLPKIKRDLSSASSSQNKKSKYPDRESFQSKSNLV